MTTTDPSIRASSPVPGPWRDLPAAPRKPVHAFVARALLRRAVRRHGLRFELPGAHNGRLRPPPPQSPREHADGSLIRVRDDAFFHRVGASGSVGFGEAYMAGDWDADDIASALEPLAAHATRLVPQWMQRLRRLYLDRLPAEADNTVHRARRNVARHYDLSNELFALFLDDSMTYSSALFDPGDTLEQAQARKIDRILDGAAIGEGTRVLEIGTGWGALAIRAARRGAHVTTLTLSREQQVLADELITRAGVADRVDVQLCDYRDATGSYDAIVSVEMIEAVGEKYWPAFFHLLDELLAPGGRVGLQAIVLPHERMLATRDQHTWVHKYIFPGGALPSLKAIDDLLHAETTLRIDDQFAFGDHYATTLRCWRERFAAHAADVDALGFDETFRRMWNFYLSYSGAGFATEYLDVVQLVLRRAKR